MAQNSKDVLFKSKVNTYISEKLSQSDTPPAFSVTDDGNGNYTVGRFNGNVTLTLLNGNYIFTPARGDAVTIAAASVTSIVVDTIILSANATVLDGETIIGSGVVVAEKLQEALSADFSNITTCVFNAEIENASQTPVVLDQNLSLGNATVGSVITLKSGITIANSNLTLPQNTSFVVEQEAVLNVDEGQLEGGFVSGAGEVSVNLTQISDFSNFTLTGDVLGIAYSSVDISSNAYLANVTGYYVNMHNMLTLTAEQANGRAVYGEGSVTIVDMDANQNIHVETTGTNTIAGGKGADAITLGEGEDTLIYHFGDETNDSDSTLQAYDIIKNFTFGVDKIELKNEAGEASYMPGSFWRFNDIDGTNITNEDIFINELRDILEDNNLSANTAGIFAIQNGSYEGVYVYINNSNAQLQEDKDIFIKMIDTVNLAELGEVGYLEVSNYFSGEIVPFSLSIVDGIITFNGAESGDISLSIEGDIITFTLDGIAADVTFDTIDWAAGITRIDLATNQLLMLTHEQAGIFATLATTDDTTYTAIGGEGAVNITAETFTEYTNLLFISNNLDLNFNWGINASVELNATLWIHPQHLDGSIVTGDGSVVVSLHNNDTAHSTFSILTTGENVIGATGNADNITTGAGTNTIIAGAGADIITLGDAIGNDIIIIKALDSTPTLYDKIINFDITQDKLILEYEATLLDNFEHVDIDSITDGIVAFNNVAAQNDEAGFTAKLSALFTELADTTNMAAFIHNGDTYVVQGDGYTGMQESDIVVQLQGINTLNDLNVVITAGIP